MSSTAAAAALSYELQEINKAAAVRCSGWFGVDADRRTASADNAEDDKRHQVEQNDSCLEDRHPSVVNGVELITGQSEPPTVRARNPIAPQHEEQKLHQKIP